MEVATHLGKDIKEVFGIVEIPEKFSGSKIRSLSVDTEKRGVSFALGIPGLFPYKEIEKLYNQLDIKDPNIDQLLLTQKVSAFPILNIIFKDKIAPGKQYDMDHTHPEVIFKNLSGISFTTIDDKKLAWDGVTYNSVKNLQLLQVSPNRSKNKMSLSAWVNAATNPNQLMLDHCIPTNVSLDIADFGKYIVERSKLLATLLKQNL